MTSEGFANDVSNELYDVIEVIFDQRFVTLAFL